MPAGGQIPFPEERVLSEGDHFIKYAPRGESEAREHSREAFRNATGLIYLSELEYRDDRTYQRLRRRCADALAKGYMGTESRWLGTFHANQIRSHSVADVSIRWIDETLGFGLFAEKDIRAWEYIGEYTGVVRRSGLLFRNINEYCFAYPTSAMYFRKYIIDSRWKGNELRYINHSDSPNCESMGVLCDGLLHIIARAIKDISACTQITYDYADFFWAARTRVPNLPEMK